MRSSAAPRRLSGMREYLEQLLLVVAIGSAVASAAKRVGVPYNVALVLVPVVGRISWSSRR